MSWFGEKARPVMPAERVWAGEGVLAGLEWPRKPPPVALTLLESRLRLRASEKAPGKVYGDRRAERIGNRTVRIRTRLSDVEQGAAVASL